MKIKKKIIYKINEKIMKNILKNNSVLKYNISINETNNSTIIDIKDNERVWTAIFSEGEYTKLFFKDPTGSTYFIDEEDFLSHVEGDRTVGKFKPNPPHWRY